MTFREPISDFETIVIKLGSNVVAGEDQKLDLKKLEVICHEMALLHQMGKNLILISSGAISVGQQILNLRSKDIEVLQAQSSIGQPLLMRTYSEIFAKSSINCAQLLLTHDDFKNRRRFLNAKNTLNTLLKNKILPILNENDGVSFTEITVGDNDHLAAMTAQMVEADVLLLITSSNGLYDDDPEKPGSQRIPKVNYGDDLSQIKTKTKTSQGRGGMGSKLMAIQKVTPLGIIGLISPANSDSPILSPLKEDVGTLFIPNHLHGPDKRKAWLISTQKPHCAIHLDEGAHQALLNHKSLLPKGILSLSGQFERGDCVAIMAQNKQFALGLVEYSHKDLAKILGKNSSEIERQLGYKISDEAIHKNNLVLKET